MIICDLCGEAKVCLPKEIDRREYDICSACWNVLTQKLQGKGRRIRETVFLPLPRTPKEREEAEKQFIQLSQQMRSIREKLPQETEYHGWVWLFTRNSAPTARAAAPPPP